MASLTDHVRETRYAARRLAAAPAFAIASIVILALTLGVGTALFSVINSMMLRPMTFEERPGIIRVTWGERGRDLASGRSMLPALVSRQLFFEDGFTSVQLAGFTRNDLAVSIGGHARVVLAEAIAGSYFQIVEATAVSGRLLRHEDTDPAAPTVAVISERLWRATRNRGADSVGGTIVVGGRSAIVVGVVGGSFQGLALRGVVTDVWLPAQDQTVGHAFGRLRNRATRAQADAEIKGRVSLAGLEARYAEFVIGIGEGLLGAIPVVGYLAGAASFALCGVVVLVAGASVTNLVLARTSGRRAEIAVRLVLGAGERDIRRLVSRELWLIALAAGALSIGSAMLTVRLVLDLLVRSDRVALNLQPDWRILTYAALATFVTVVVISRIIAGHASQIDALTTVSASAGAGGSTPQSDLARRRLLAVQVGGSTMLLILAALLVRSAAAGLSYPPGFDPIGAAVGWIDHRSQGHDVELARTIERRVLEIARGTPGASSVAIASALPIDGRGVGVSVIADSGSQQLRASLKGVSTQFFGAFGLDLRRGRDLSEMEVAEKLSVAVISESAAAALWPRHDPIGRRFRMADFSRLERDWIEYTVVGVSADAPAASGRSDASESSSCLTAIRSSPGSRFLSARKADRSGSRFLSARKADRSDRCHSCAGLSRQAPLIWPFRIRACWKTRSSSVELSGACLEHS